MFENLFTLVYYLLYNGVTPRCAIISNNCDHVLYVVVLNVDQPFTFLVDQRLKSPPHSTSTMKKYLFQRLKIFENGIAG